MNQVLFVSDADKDAIKKWPAALRAIFDPRADLEQARQVAAEKQQSTPDEPRDAAGDGVPLYLSRSTIG